MKLNLQNADKYRNANHCTEKIATQCWSFLIFHQGSIQHIIYKTSMFLFFINGYTNKSNIKLSTNVSLYVEEFLKSSLRIRFEMHK